MLERLLGRYLATRKYESPADLAEILKSLIDGHHRVNIYDSSGTTLLAYTDPERGKVLLIGLDSEERPTEPPDIGELREGYVEIFALSKETQAMDLDIIAHEARVNGRDLKELMREVSIEELKQAAGTGREAGEEVGEEAGLESLYREMKDFMDVDELLSTALTKPSGIAKILVVTEEVVIHNIGLEEALSLIRNYMLSPRIKNLAIRLKAGDNEAWLIKLGGKAGIALIKGGRPVLWGSDVIKRLPEVDKYVKKVMRDVGKVDMHVYMLPEKFSYG